MQSKATPFHWVCPFCGLPATITGAEYHSASVRIQIGPSDETFNQVLIETVRCPSPMCHRYTLEVAEHETHLDEKRVRVTSLTPAGAWRLRPPAAMKVFPNYIPDNILNAYRDACLTAGAVPTASAAMARRCLQGMIRHRWDVKNKPNLALEIEALQEKVDPLTWKAIDGVRSIGNIGAHMEKDVNVIIEIDPGEADLLIGLIETLLTEWYVAERARQERLQRVVDAAAAKEAAKGSRTTPA